MDFGDKGAPKAMSGRTGFCFYRLSVFPTGDSDPDSASYERADEPPPDNPATDGP